MCEKTEANVDLAVETRNLTRRFGTLTALDDVSLSVPRGSVFGLVGVNAAGKTTLLKHVLGLLRAEAGSVRVFGLDPVADPVRVSDHVAMIHEGRIVICGSLDQIQASYHRLTIRFDEPRKEPPSIPGVLGWKGAGYEWTVISNGCLEEFRQTVSEAGGRIVEEKVPSLDEIFVGRVEALSLISTED